MWVVKTCWSAVFNSSLSCIEVVEVLRVHPLEFISRAVMRRRPGSEIVGARDGWPVFVFSLISQVLFDSRVRRKM